MHSIYDRYIEFVFILKQEVHKNALILNLLFNGKAVNFKLSELTYYKDSID